MENASNIFPLLFCFCLGFIIIVPFTVLVIYLLQKAKNSSWQGKIIEKLHKIGLDEDGDKVDYFSVKIKKNDGREFNVAISKLEYDDFKEGDILLKQQGEFKPRKIS